MYVIYVSTYYEIFENPVIELGIYMNYKMTRYDHILMVKLLKKYEIKFTHKVLKLRADYNECIVGQCRECSVSRSFKLDRKSHDS